MAVVLLAIIGHPWEQWCALFVPILPGLTSRPSIPHVDKLFFLAIVDALGATNLLLLSELLYFVFYSKAFCFHCSLKLLLSCIPLYSFLCHY